MNSTLKSALIFLGGAACGAAGMFFGVKGYFMKKSSDEIDRMMKYVDETYRPVDQKKTANSKKMIAEKKEKVKEIEKSLNESYAKSISNTKNHTDYNRIGKSDDIQAEKEHPEEDENRQPYIIAEEDWASPEPYYEKITLLYDKNEQALTDYDTEELIVNPGDVLGLNVMNSLDSVHDGTYVYVRDDTTSKDYEIEVREIEDYDDETDA